MINMAKMGEHGNPRLKYTSEKSYNSNRDRQEAEDLYRQCERIRWLDGSEGRKTISELEERAKSLERKSWIDRRENDD